MIDSPYLPFAMAISATLHSQKNLETHQNRLSRFFQQHPQPGQPAQTAPGGEHHSGLASFHLRMVRSSTSSRLASWDICEADQRPDHADFTG